MVRSTFDFNAQPTDSGKSFLLIEDNPDHAFLVRKAVWEALRTSVEIAESGEAGLIQLRRKPYDLLITDFNLPGMDGLEVLQTVKELGIDIPLIMLTGQGDEKVAVAALQAGAYNYIVKDDICYTVLPRVISETLIKYQSDKEKQRLEKEIREKSEALEKANQELERANEELKKLDELKSVFLSSVTHEFKNPLNSIREGIELILDGIVDPQSEKGKHILEIAKGSVERLTILVNDLLDFSKLEAGKMRMEKEPLEIKHVCSEAVESMRPLAEKKNLNLIFTPSSEKVVVYMDPLRIIQVLTNLIGNAIKFTPEKGTIEVSYEPFLDTEKPSQKVRVWVKDTGIGISPENLKRIFKRFEQVKLPHRGPTPELQGTGLGLSICDEIIRLHQGRIWAESKPDKGSVFSFTLLRYR